MLHQSLPLYEGNQPFIYAFYCAEDDDIAFPVLARMYNEGFRIWCASAGGVANDFRTIQRMNAGATIMLFLSRNMLELLRMGDAEVVAAAKNPRLHMTVSVDGTKADKSMWALAVPDELEYMPGNDAAFWLYMYTSDKLEKCRGPWPEKKITYRESDFGFFPERALQEEYEKLETIIRSDNAADGRTPEESGEKTEYDGAGSLMKDEKADPKHTKQYRNNAGYIAPEPDNYLYTPLERIEVTKSEEEKEFDAFIGYLDRCVEAEEKSVAEQQENMKYVSGSRKDDEEKTPDQPEETFVPVPEITPRFSDPKDPPPPTSKIDRVISMHDQFSSENLNPEARRRRMYENGRLEKVLDPNEIEATERRRKIEELMKAEEQKRRENESAAKEAARLFESISPSKEKDRDGQSGDIVVSVSAPDISGFPGDSVENVSATATGADAIPSGPDAEKSSADIMSVSDGEQTEPAAARSTSDPIPSVSGTVPASDFMSASDAGLTETGKADDISNSDKRDSLSGISEESLESIIDRSDIPERAEGMPSPEQLAAAPTYIIVPPSGGVSIDAPSCLKLIETDGGIIAVPAQMPEEMPDGPKTDGAAADNGPEALDGIVSNDMFVKAGTSSGDTVRPMNDPDTIPEQTEKKRHTIARKIISHKRGGVKVTPVKCEVLRSLPQREPESGYHAGRRHYEDSYAQKAEQADVSAAGTEYNAAKNDQSGVMPSDDVQTSSMRKYRSRPFAATDDPSVAGTYMNAEAYGGADEMIEELEPRQSHRKNKHPHSQNGLLANIMAMLSRGYADGAISGENGDDGLFGAAQTVPNDGAANGSDQLVNARDNGADILSLSAAVEKFIEIAPPDSVMVVPKLK